MARFRLPQYDSSHSRLFLVSMAFWIGIILLSILLFLYGPTTIPLWYSLVQPEEQLAPNWALGTIVGLSTFFLFTGLWWGRKTDLEHEQYLATMTWWSVMFLQGLLLLSLIRIVKVII